MLPLLIAGWGCALHPRPVGSGPVGLHEVELPLYRAHPGGDKLYVEATLSDGEPRFFLVDTGSSVSVLRADVARELGLEVRPVGGHLVGLAGATTWNQAELDRISLGALSFHGVEFAVGVPGVPSRAGLVPVAGLLGNNIWGELRLTLDYPANMLRLEAAPMGGLGPHAQPMYFNGQHITTGAVIVAEGGDMVIRQPVLLEVDTGARGLVISGSSGAGLEPLVTEGWEPIYGIGAGDDLPANNFLRQTRRVGVRAVEVGGARVDVDMSATWINFDRSRPPVGPVGMPGLLGHKVLEGHRVILDYPNQQMLLLPGSEEATPRDLHERHLARLRPEREHRVERARLLAWLDRGPEAMRTLRQHLAQDPGDPRAVALLARLVRQEGDPSGALEALMALDAGTLVDVEELIGVVNGLWLDDRGDEALLLARQATAARPGAPHAWVGLADALRASRDPVDARKALAEANRLDENPDGHLLRRAWIASDEGDVFAGLTHVRRLLELHPTGGVALWFYTHQAREAEATTGTAAHRLLRADIQRSIARLHPGDGPLDFLAAAFRELGDEARAQELTESGIARDCASARSATRKANCTAWYLALGGGSLDQAAQQIATALVEEPERAEFLDTLAVVHEALGEDAKAHEAAWRAARQYPDDIYLLWQAERLALQD